MAARRYDNSHRGEQAAQTRAAVIAAAGERFAGSGYAATAIRDVADAAGVSVETIYKSFGSKVELLRHWIEGLTAGPEPVPVIDQPWVAEMRSAADPRARLEIAVRSTAEIFERTATAMIVLAAAAHADEHAAELWAEMQRQRRSDVRSLVSMVLGGDGSGDHGEPDDDLVDAVYALTEPHLHHVLVGQRRWSRDRYATWITDVLWSQIGAGSRTKNRTPTKETPRP